MTWRQGASKNLGRSSAAADSADQTAPGGGQSVAKLVVTGLPGGGKLEDLSEEDRAVIEAALEAARKSGFQGGELAAGAVGAGQGAGEETKESDSLGWTTVAVRQDGVAVCIPTETWKGEGERVKRRNDGEMYGVQKSQSGGEGSGFRYNYSPREGGSPYSEQGMQCML